MAARTKKRGKAGGSTASRGLVRRDESLLQGSTADQLYRWMMRTIVTCVVCPIVVWGTLKLAEFLHRLDVTSSASLTALTDIRSDFAEYKTAQALKAAEYVEYFRTRDKEYDEYRRSIDGKILGISAQLTEIVGRLSKVETTRQTQDQFTGGPK